jgi:DNA-binding IclR family transcriptional regulator
VLAVDPPSYRSAVMTTPDDLRAELERIRDDGYALLRGHVNRESLAIAVPVRDGSGTVVGALGVVLPIDTSGTSEVQLLLAASRGITRALVANPLERRLAAARSHLVD